MVNQNCRKRKTLREIDSAGAGSLRRFNSCLQVSKGNLKFVEQA